MNLLITSAPRWAMLQFVLVTLALMPALIYGHGQHGNGVGKKHAIALAELASGARLVMETRNGDVLVRPAREAAPAAGAAVGPGVELPVGTPATVGTVGGSGKRVKNNNKKSNKSQNQMQQQQQQQGRKSGHKKSSTIVGESEPLHHNNKQRQTPRQHQQLTQHRAGKRSGGAGKKASEKGECKTEWPTLAGYLQTYR